MKKRIILTLLIIVFIPQIKISGAADTLSDRHLVINFEGKLLDENNLSYNGNINVVARFHKGPYNYSEKFDAVPVEKGFFRIPLFNGVSIEGTALAIDSLTSPSGNLIADIIINDVPFLESYSLGSYVSAIRSEHSLKADLLKNLPEISASAIPNHNANLITSGRLDSARIPQIPGTKIASGTFLPNQIPSLDAGIIQSGNFGGDAFAGDIPAGWFTTGGLGEALIPYEVMRIGKYKIFSGSVNDEGVIPISGDIDRSNCTWTVSLNTTKANGETEVGIGNGIDLLKVLTDSNGVVDCRWDTDSEESLYSEPCTANYIAICER